MRSLTWTTGMGVARWSSSAMMPLCVGSRCWTMTKAMPLSVGHVPQELLQRLQPAGGGADADDGESCRCPAETASLRKPRPARASGPRAGISSSCFGASFGEKAGNAARGTGRELNGVPLHKWSDADSISKSPKMRQPGMAPFYSGTDRCVGGGHRLVACPPHTLACPKKGAIPG